MRTYRQRHRRPDLFTITTNGDVVTESKFLVSDQAGFHDAIKYMDSLRNAGIEHNIWIADRYVGSFKHKGEEKI